MKMTHLYNLYHLIGQGPIRYYGLRVMDFLGIRHKVVRMDIRMGCNLRCPSCYFSKDEEGRFKQPQMSLENFEKIAKDLFPKTLVLSLSCGGEPLIVKDFEKYVDIVGKYKVPTVTLPTNGTMLKDNHVEALIRNKVTEICFSMDGAQKETYERFRAGANFERVIGNIKNLIKRKEELGSSLPSIRFNFVMNKDNIREVPDFIKLADSLTGETIMFRHFTNWGGSLSYNEYSLLHFPELYNEYYEKAKEVSRECNVETLLPKPFKLRGQNNSAQKQGSHASDGLCLERYGCVNPWFYVYIRPDGSYRPCTYLDFEGNIIKQTFAEYQKTEVPSKRKWLLLNDLEHSCMHDVCQGHIVGRVNDDSNLKGQ